ncbi:MULTISPECIES: MFS transporter [Hyphobacterium]|uniref:MFS transporter n=1 Tax=Hyphobacterium vulgare TaxID=1736751 RepID=A0ABV7A0L6_9PROT
MKLAFGVGAVASGVKTSAFDYFLLLFYSQVVGLDARLVGFAILVALVFDAISDPLVGYWSDNLRSRWGRRHPFMYISAIPVALSFFLLWNPPADASQHVLFWYLLVLAVTIRTAITFFETPSSALVPELTKDYDERTSLFSLRVFFGWFGGNVMSVMMFFLLFPLLASEAFPDGRFNPDAYQVYGIVGSLVIFVAILVCALGTHSNIAHLEPAPPARQMTLKRIFGEIFETLSERSFVALFASALLGAVASGVAASLSYYFLTYFWSFSEIQTGVILLGTFVAAGIGLVLAPIVSRTIGKKRGAMIVGLIAFVGSPMPIVLRLIGVLPENGEPFVFWFVLITNIVDIGLIICFQILFFSMVADLVEQSEVKTGRRSEGVFTATVTFIRKSVQGLGVLTASFVLALAAFPVGGDTSDVSETAIWRLGALYVPTVLILWLAMIAAISAYKIDRTSHEINLEKLRTRP